MAYGVVRTDKMFGTDNRSGIAHVKYIVTSGSGSSETKTETAIENGRVLKLVGLIDREVYEGADPAANTPLSEIVLVASPELMYDERKHNLDEYINEAGKICRGYRVHTYDEFGLTKDALDGKATPAIGDTVELQASTKMKVVSSATQGSTVVGKIIAIETAGRYTYYVIHVA